MITATLCSCRKGANDGVLLLEALCSVGNSRSKGSIFYAGKMAEPLPGAESVAPELQQQPSSSSSDDTALMEGRHRSSKATRNDRYVCPTQGGMLCSEMGLSPSSQDYYTGLKASSHMQQHLCHTSSGSPCGPPQWVNLCRYLQEFSHHASLTALAGRQSRLAPASLK